MEFIFKLVSSSTCCANCRQQLRHCKRKRNERIFHKFTFGLSTRVWHLLPFDLASCKKLPISAVGKRMKCSEPFLSRISTLSSCGNSQKYYFIVKVEINVFWMMFSDGYKHAATSASTDEFFGRQQSKMKKNFLSQLNDVPTSDYLTRQ